jgi:hypothetical protein
MGGSAIACTFQENKFSVKSIFTRVNMKSNGYKRQNFYGAKFRISTMILCHKDCVFSSDENMDRGLLGYEAVLFCEWLPTVLRSILSPSSG